jgi:hypothetical protein
MRLLSDISRTADISLRIYLRTEAISGQSGKNDPYMGSVKIQPDFNKLVRMPGIQLIWAVLINTHRLLLINGTTLSGEQARCS